MKKILLPLGIAFGVIIGWFLKSAPDSTPADTAPSVVVQPQKALPANTGIRERSSLPEKANSREPKASGPIISFGTSGSGMQAPSEKQMKKWHASVMKRQNAKFEARLAKLAKELDLSPEQIAQLRKVWEDEVATLGEGPEAFMEMQKLNALLTGNGLDEDLANILSEDQGEQYEELKEQEFANKVESTALKNLAKLSFLNLRDEQKDAVMGILYEQAEASAKTESPLDAMVGAISTMGGGLSDSMGGSGDAASLIELSGISSGGLSNEEKIESLAPVLDPEQLEEYRTSLGVR